jgi:hypothetical protein
MVVVVRRVIRERTERRRLQGEGRRTVNRSKGHKGDERSKKRKI